jgi:hypothetical protein
MKRRLLTLGIALGAVALTSTAAAGPTQSAGTHTFAQSWTIEHEDLLRQFSRGLGVDLSNRDTVGASADHNPGHRTREPGVKRAGVTHSTR